MKRNIKKLSNEDLLKEFTYAYRMTYFDDKSMKYFDRIYKEVMIRMIPKIEYKGFGNRENY